VTEEPFFVNEIIPKLFEEYNIPDPIIINISKRLKNLGDSLAGQTGKEVYVFDIDSIKWIEGFIDGICLMLITLQLINGDDYIKITSTWIEKFPRRQ
jgi:hypothetical protein